MRWLLIAVFVIVNLLTVLAHGDEDHRDENDADGVEASGISVPENPTYHEHARPIIEANCVACHSDGQIAGYAPFSDPQDVIWAAEDIKFHVSRGLMPPWMPSRENLPLKHDRSLSDEDIAIIIAWVDAGAELGDPAAYVPAATEGFDFTEVRADAILQLEEPYAPTEEALDDYRCFAFTGAIEAPQFITGYEFLPGVLAMAHHAILYLVDGALADEIAERDGADGRPGWSCYGTTGLSESGSIIATWTPGAFGITFPSGTGYLVEPNQIMVLQMHYNLWTTRQPDRTRVNLQLESGAADLDELWTIPLNAPVEIPCPSGVSGPQCERETALDRIGELYGEALRELPDRRLRRCRQTLEDYAENTGENARSFCDYPSPFFEPLTVYGVLGHMHELGRSFRMELNPDGDDPRLLLDIPRWNFHWQDRYQFVEPVQIEFGSVLRMSCRWDNSLSEDPRYVVWGEGTADEMCFGTVMALKP